MKALSLIAFLLLIISLTGCGFSNGQANGAYTDDLELNYNYRGNVLEGMPKAGGIIVNWSHSQIREIISSQKPFALYFNSPSCETCTVYASSINNAVSELPDGSIIVKVDYDRNVALRKQYGVVVSETFVLITPTHSRGTIINAPQIAQLNQAFTEVLNQ